MKKSQIIINRVLKRFQNRLLTNQDRKLVDLIFSIAPTQQDVDNFLRNYDIEACESTKTLMLSYFMKDYPHLKFSQYEAPRLKGLFNFYRFANLKLMTYFVKIGKELNKNKIPFLIVKGFAMKYLRQNLSRPMGDIDILVEEKNYIKAINLLKSMNYRLDIYAHSVDIHEPESDAGIMDIHRFFDLHSKKERSLNKYLFARAQKQIFNGIEILIPSYEDIFFLILANLTVNLENKTSKGSVLFSLFDTKFLLQKPSFDWSVVIYNAKITKTLPQIIFAIEFLNSLVPNLIPKEKINPSIYKRNVENYSAFLDFSLKFYPAFQKIARRTKFKTSIKNCKSFIYYAKIKIIYLFLKQIKNKPMLIKLILLNFVH